MNTIFPEKQKLLKELTPAQASGAAYSLSAILSILSSFVFVIVIGAFGLAQEGYGESDWFLYSSFLLPQLCFFALTVVFIKSGKLATREIFVMPKARYFILAIVLQIGLLSLSELNAWFLELLKVVGYESDGVSVPSLEGFGFLGVLFVVAVLPALFEEIFFRGILLKGLKGFGEIFAVLVCGALFSLYHKNPSQTVYQFVCGAAFALVAIRSGSILPTALSHFLNNAWIITMTKFNWTLDAIYLPFLIISIVCLLVSAAYLLFIDKKAKKLPTEAEVTQENKNARKEFFLYASVGIALCALTWLVTLFSGM